MLRTLYNGVTYFLREFTLVNFNMSEEYQNYTYYEYPVYKGDADTLRTFMSEKLRILYMQSNDMLYLLTSFDVKRLY